MILTSPDFAEGDRIPDSCAFGIPAPEAHMAFGPNRNPALEWSGAPEGTRSFALTMVDGDVPTRPDDVNQEGREVPPELPRGEFTHWLVVDIPADQRGIGQGEYGAGVTAGGGAAADNEGVNDYTGWFEGDPDMEGTYRGYDGPCPPWNDSLLHHYTLTLYALDVASLGLSGEFTLEEVRAAVAGHTLAEAALTGTYALNPRLIGD
jgi:Raf kinase inhibitor-like YbhB/YbcL family protein